MGHNSIIPRRLSEDHKNDLFGTSMRSVFFFCPIVLFVLVLFPSSSALADDTARKLLALIDYIGTDYKNAVQAGKIVNQDEYQEQLEFSKRSLELFDQLKEADKTGVEPDLKMLAKQIENKADTKMVSAVADSIKSKMMTAYHIVPYPRQLPSFEAGRLLFAQNCSQCHGEAGK